MTGDPKTEPPKGAPLTGTLKAWWELGLSVVTTFVAVLASLGLGRLGQAIALSVAAVAFAVTVLLWRRRRNRKVVLTDRIQAYRHWRERVSDSAFRGLYAFGRGDVLPGVERRRTAVALATSVKSERFRFGVISGDVGCGKTSFVNAVASLLEGSGFKVLVCEGLHGLHQAAPGSKADPGVAQVVSRLREDSAAKAGGEPFILIIDQFEEFLIRYVLPGERQQLGDFLHQPIPGAESRVLCAVRSDYLLEMHDLAPALPEPLSTRSLFRLRNFSIEEAEEVILECAERDDVPISREFATLIAQDLSHGSFVRPAELQIVCSALSGNPSLEAYRAASGSAAILSEYIRNALEISVDPQLARVVLRSFCDFDALPPAKAQPRTQDEIAELLALDTAAQRKLDKILASLEESRLVTSLPQDDHQALLYVLVHDYLVGSIAAATGDLRTPNEVADQDLRGFLFQFRSDPKTRIPLRKIASLEKRASRTLLDSTEAVDLRRRSKRSHLARAGLAALAVGLAAATVWTMATSQARWEQVVIDRVSPGEIIVFYPLASRKVLGVAFDTPNPSIDHRISLWNAQTGRNLLSDRAGALFFSPHRELLLKARPRASVLDLVDLTRGTSIATPFRLNQGPLNGTAFLSERLLVTYEGVGNRPSTVTARLWSLPDWRAVGSLANLDPWGDDPHPVDVRLLSHADRWVFLARRNHRLVPFIWTIHRQGDMRQLRPLISSAENDVRPGEAAINEQETMLIALERTNKLWNQICAWNLPLGTLVLCRDPSAPGDDKGRVRNFAISFSRDGKYAYVTTTTISDDPALFGIYGTTDLLPPPDGPPRNAMIAPVSPSPVLPPPLSPAPDPEFVAVWEGPAGSARYWRASDHRISTLPNFSARSVLRMETSADGRFLLVTRRNGEVELWDLERNGLVRRLQRAGLQAPTSFTMDRRTISVYSEGGVFTFYDGRTGRSLATLPVGISVNLNRSRSMRFTPLFYRDEECQRYHVWTPEGLVYRYQRGRNIPFRGFVPNRRTPRCR
jgi:hypothetical protein